MTLGKEMVPAVLDVAPSPFGLEMVANLLIANGVVIPFALDAVEVIEKIVLAPFEDRE